MNLGELFWTALPDPEELASSASAVASRAEMIINSRAATLWQMAGQQLSTSIGARMGVTFPEEIVAIRNIAARSALNLTVNALSTTEIAQALQAGIRSVSGILSSIPLVNIVVKILQFFGGKTREAIQQRKAERYHEPQKPTVFSPEADSALYNDAVLPAIRGRGEPWSNLGEAKNATNIWMPPSLKQGNRPAFFAGRLTNGWWRVTGNYRNPEWVGMVPGTIFLHSDIEGAFDTGRLLPTVQTSAGQLWGQLGHNGPLQFSVNVSDLVRAWEDYLEELRVWLDTEADIPGDVYRQIISVYSNKDKFGWRKEKDGPNGPWGIQAATPVNFARGLAQAQSANLKTVTAAYLDETYAALQDRNRAALWEVERKNLLQKPERFAVDVNSIPDPAYADAMAKAQEDVPVGGVPDIIEVPDNGPGFVGLQLGSGRSSSSAKTRKVSTVVAAAAMAGAGYFAWKKLT